MFSTRFSTSSWALQWSIADPRRARSKSANALSRRLFPEPLGPQIRTSEGCSTVSRAQHSRKTLKGKTRPPDLYNAKFQDLTPEPVREASLDLEHRSSSVGHRLYWLNEDWVGPASASALV